MDAQSFIDHRYGFIEGCINLRRALTGLPRFNLGGIHDPLSLRLVFFPEPDDQKRQPVCEQPQNDPFFAQSEELEDLHVDPQPVNEQEDEQDQMDQGSKFSQHLFVDHMVRDDRIDEEQVHDPAVHAFSAEPDRITQTIKAVSRNPGRPSLLPVQFFGDHEQGERKKRPFIKSG